MATLTMVEILAYALASALYLGYLFASRAPITRAARVVLAVGVAAQLTDIGLRCYARQNPVSSTPEAVAFVGFLIASGTLLGAIRYRLAAAGAFAVPASLTLLVLARVVPVEVDGPRMGSLGRTHIFLATLGVAVFALAAVLAGLYLLEERRLKRKRFDRVGREAPLATLDRLALRCVSIGFPIFTVAMVTGAVWIARLGGLSSGAVRPEYLIAIAAWLAFGVLLVARVGAGWRGRRAAWLTLGGFSGTLAVLFFYVLRYAV
ncbi:MAG: cytochrome c biogenesis protein CcsA [Bacteroidota bacterium]